MDSTLEIRKQKGVNDMLTLTLLLIFGLCKLALLFCYYLIVWPMILIFGFLAKLLLIPFAGLGVILGGGDELGPR